MSLEPRVFATVAGDQGLKDIFNNDLDFYSHIAIKTEKKSQKATAELVVAEQKDTGSVNFSDVIEIMKFTQFGLFGFFLYFFFCIAASLS